MSSKRDLSASPPSEQNNINGTETQPKDSSKSDLCLICGDPARINNYGALSCQSCKTFFRRNGFRPETVRPCIFNQNCEVNIYTRHNCTACRLAKCFRVGMSSDLIRKEDHKKAKNSSSTKSDNAEQVTTVTTSNHIQDGQFFLSNSEWTLLSNILHAYDTFSIAPQICQSIDGLIKSPIKIDGHVISPLEIVSQIFTSIQSFINVLPDFRILTIDEQTSLLERNLHGVMGFYCILISRDTQILHNNKCMEAFTSIYGSEIILLVKNANDELDPDSTLVKLMLMVLIFSSHCFNHDNGNIEHDRLLYGTFRLLGSQNVYLELLWKYMIYRYGYFESVPRFSRLIKTFLCVLKTVANIYMTNQTHQTMVDNIIEKIKQNLITNENEQIPLWGKT